MEIESVFVQASKSHKPRFCKCPKAFNPINVGMLFCKFVIAMLNTKMLMIVMTHFKMPDTNTLHSSKPNHFANTCPSDVSRWTTYRQIPKHGWRQRYSPKFDSGLPSTTAPASYRPGRNDVWIAPSTWAEQVCPSGKPNLRSPQHYHISYAPSWWQHGHFRL